MSPATYWLAVENFARYYGPGVWQQRAAEHDNPLAYRFSIRRPVGMRTAYADWPAVMRDARRANGFAHPEFLAALCWYASAVLVRPNWQLCRLSASPMLRELSEHRYGDVFAPVLPWATLNAAPQGGRWNDARIVRILRDNNGPYQLEK